MARSRLNRLMGESVTVTGLLAGNDILAAVGVGFLVDRIGLQAAMYGIGLTAIGCGLVAARGLRALGVVALPERQVLVDPEARHGPVHDLEPPPPARVSTGDAGEFPVGATGGSVRVPRTKSPMS
mgnify:CR=1 FL=1